MLLFLVGQVGYLRRHEARGATPAKQVLLRIGDRRQPEIDDHILLLSLTLLPNHNVVGFQIPVDDVPPLHLSQCLKEMPHALLLLPDQHLPGHSLFESRFQKLHFEVVGLVSLKNVVKRADERVFQLFQDFDLVDEGFL